MFPMKGSSYWNGMIRALGEKVNRTPDGWDPEWWWSNSASKNVEGCQECQGKHNATQEEKCHLRMLLGLVADSFTSTTLFIGFNTENQSIDEARKTITGHDIKLTVKTVVRKREEVTRRLGTLKPLSSMGCWGGGRLGNAV